MPVLRKLFLYCLAAIAVVFLADCKGKKKQLTGDELANVIDFIEIFPQPVISLQAGDTIFAKKQNDSLAVSYKTLVKFIPDSVMGRVFGKGLKPKSYPLGRMEDENKTNYLLVKTVAGENRAVILYCFSKDEKLVGAMNLLKPDQSAATTQSASIDRNFNISKNTLLRKADGTQRDGKEVYVLNEDAKNFMLILTEQLDDKPKEFINPIDTMQRKNKFSADYSNSKKNLVSIRDGKKPDQLIFFIYFEQNNGECTGELKGEIKLTGKNTAEYKEGGDPCVMQFVFSGTSVTLKEVEGCAAHRGLRCSFDGSYAKKKIIKPKK